MNLKSVKASDRRSTAEWIFLVLFYPSVLLFYVIYKYPEWLLPEGGESSRRKIRRACSNL